MHQRSTPNRRRAPQQFLPFFFLMREMICNVCEVALTSSCHGLIECGLACKRVVRACCCTRAGGSGDALFVRILARAPPSVLCVVQRDMPDSQAYRQFNSGHARAICKSLVVCRAYPLSPPTPPRSLTTLPLSHDRTQVKSCTFCSPTLFQATNSPPPPTPLIPLTPHHVAPSSTSVLPHAHRQNQKARMHTSADDTSKIAHLLLFFKLTLSASTASRPLPQPLPPHTPREDHAAHIHTLA